jgi:hypothetical protein
MAAWCVPDANNSVNFRLRQHWPDCLKNPKSSTANWASTFKSKASQNKRKSKKTSRRNSFRSLSFLPSSPSFSSPTEMATDERRSKVLADYRKRLIEHRELEEKLKQSWPLLPSRILTLHSAPRSARP